MARFWKKKLDNLKAKMLINSCLLVGQLSIVWKQKVDIITEIEEESGQKFKKLFFALILLNLQLLLLC